MRFPPLSCDVERELGLERSRWTRTRDGARAWGPAASTWTRYGQAGGASSIRRLVEPCTRGTAGERRGPGWRHWREPLVRESPGSLAKDHSLRKASHRLVPHQMTYSGSATLGPRDGGEQRVGLGVGHDVGSRVEAGVRPAHQTSATCLQ